MEDLQGYDSFDETRFNQLREKYGATFAVTGKKHQLNFRVLYQNNKYTVYALRE